MPKTRENFLLLHWDKLLLLILAAAGIYVFLTRVLSSPNRTGDRLGKPTSPQQLVADLSENTAKLKSQLQQSKKIEVEPLGDYDQVKNRLEDIPRDLPRYPLTAEMPGAKEIPGLTYIATPIVLAPLNLRAQAGLGLLASASPANRGTVQPASSASGAQIYWVTVAAEFPFNQQYLAIAGLDPLIDKERRLPEKNQYLLFARLELQRQELLPDGSWSQAESINPYQLYSRDLPDTVKNLSELYTLPSGEEQSLSNNVDVLKSWLSRSGFQEFIVRPEFLTLDGFEQCYWPEESPDLTDTQSRFKTFAGELPKRDEAPRYRAIDKTIASTTAVPRTPAGYLLGPDAFRLEGPMLPNLLGPTGTGPAAIGPRPMLTGRGRGERIPITQKPGLEYAPKTIQMWAYDSTVLPGRTYRYRMQVLLFNPLCGNERAESRKVRTLAWLEGQWSAWSAPVETMQKHYFFFTGVSSPVGAKPPRARVSVYAWQDGWWYTYPFSYSDPGQRIGSSMEVPDYRPASLEDLSNSRSGRTGVTTRSAGGGGRTPSTVPVPRPKISVDFTTGWTFVDLNPEVQLDRPVDNSSASFQAVTAPELVVMDQATKQLVERYSAIDNGDLRRQQLEEIIARQEKAFREVYSRLERPSGTPVTPDRGFMAPFLQLPRLP